MTVVFEPKIKLPAGEVMPDSYDHSLGLVPPDNFVVSRYRDGTVASVYGDMSWDQTPYHPEGRSSWLYFIYWKDAILTPARNQLIKESHWLMFLLMWKRMGSALSYASCERYLYLIRALANFSEVNSCRIQDVLADIELLTGFIGCISGGHAVLLASLQSFLWNLGLEHVGFKVLGGPTIKKIRILAVKYRKSLKQHPPIPTRIYSGIITGLAREIADFEAIADRYLALVSDCSSDPRMGRHVVNQNALEFANKMERNYGKHLPEFTELLRKHDLEQYFLDKCLTHSVCGLSNGLTQIQLVIKLQVQTFSGMRDEEAKTLPYLCMDTSNSNGITHHLLLGRTTKMNKGRIKRTRWVTTREVHSSILIAQRIADTIYGFQKVRPQKAVTRINEYPLFVSTAYLPFTARDATVEKGMFLPGCFGFRKFVELRTRLFPLIEDGDIRELEQIDLHRSWRAERKFLIGKPWVLASHQLRRSLALYAQRSGFVSLPTLRRQLQLITDEMARYYARGSAFARDFIGGDKDHFGLEWQETQPVSSAFAYTSNVLLSDNVLFGGHVNFVDNRLRGSDGTVLVDRETTLQRFKKGELAYKETILGGCTKVGECDDVALRLLDVDCLKGCPNMVVKLPNLEKVIVAQTNMVRSINPVSLEFRTEQAGLDVLIAVRDKMIQLQIL